ncbi:MAG: MXAN_2562 family outer membrane beta-barrel protein [Myxococcota bacterium]|nr:MXAN_2562 family outer membrane beta-barrel protein [Myxococcota bacterium]
MSARWLSCAALVALLAPPTISSAQDRDASHEDGSIVGSSYAIDPVFVPSSEGFTLELRMGGYQPSLGASFGATFGGDLGPFIGAELDVHLFRIPYIGPVAIGASFGWAEWSGNATAATGETSVGTTGLSLVNMNLLAVLRIDGLARYLDVPMVFSAKIGPDFGYWQTGAGGTTQAEGWSIGLRWAAQAALELDFLEPRAARRLDDEWGINHTEIFFELFGSTMGQWSDSQLPIGADLAWVAGLGFTF